MKQAKTRILIADDHALMRVGLKTMLNALPDMEVVAEADDGKQAVALTKKHRPDVVVMDLMMPVLNGAEATWQIMAALPKTRILVLTSFNTSPDLHRALKNGAAGVQLKEYATGDLVAAIRAVAAGQKVVPPEVAQQDKAKAMPRELTEKQVAILRSVTNGLTNKEIASRHNMSPSGVKKHLKLIFAKLDVQSRTEAIAAVFKKHLLKA